MIYIVRHGETDGNLKGVLRGRYFDDELTENGVAQAKNAAEQLKDIIFDVCYCSPLKRAKETCAQIYHGKTIIDNRITPRDYGEWVGKAIKEMENTGYLDREKNLRPKNGESILDFENRIKTFLDETLDKNSGKNILVVTHASVCNIIKAIIDNFSSSELYLTKNCEIIKIPN